MVKMIELERPEQRHVVMAGEPAEDLVANQVCCLLLTAERAKTACPRPPVAAEAELEPNAPSRRQQWLCFVRDRL